MLRFKNVLSAACFGCLCLSLTGCPDMGGDSNSAVGPGGSAGGGGGAKQAWKDLEGESSLGSLMSNMPLPGGGFTQGAGRMMQQAKTEADQACNQAMQSPLPVDALNSMTDEMAQYLVKTLPNEPEVKASKSQLILAFGDLVNATQNPGAEAALDQVRSKLFESELMKANFVFVNTTEDNAAKLNEKIAGKDMSAFRDPLQRTADTTGPVVYNPQDIFLITGKLYGMSDQPNHSVQITLSMQFTNVQSRRMVENKQFVRSYMWHPKKKAWELQG